MALTDKLTAIADAIRAKTGTTDGMTLEQMPSAISSIETGGGGEGVPEGYATVTFMNGADVLFTRLVLEGDDCPDPVEQERVDEPTKESTAQYTYTFNGWATADGGTTDSTALQNITEDRVLYAAFAESVRMYTVTYYDEDGVTVLHTEQVAYGAYPSYTPEHPTDPSHYLFDGWTPSLATVTGNASYTAAWKEKKALRDYTWAELDTMSIEECRANFKLGDVARDGCFLVGFEHDDLADGTGKAKMTFASFHLFAVSAKSFTSQYAYIWGDGKDWSGCNYRNSVDTYLSDATPSFYTSVNPYVKTVKKKYVATDGTIQEVDDRYFAISMAEAGYVGTPDDGTKYAYFSEKQLTDSFADSWDNERMYSIYNNSIPHYTRTIDPSTGNVWCISNQNAPITKDTSETYRRPPNLVFCI